MFAACMCSIIVDGISNTFGVFVHAFVDEFHVSVATVAWMGSLLAGFYFVSGPIVSALINKYGCRAVCIAGSIVSATAFALSTLSTRIEVLMLTYGVLGGFGFGMVNIPCIVAVGFYFESKRALATGLAVSGSGLGTFIFAPLCKFLLQQFGWKSTILILALIILLVILFGAMIKPLS